LLKEYKLVEVYLDEIVANNEYWEVVGLKISARNRLGGTVQEINKGIITAKIKIKIDPPVVVTAIISKEAVEELDIKSEDKVEAVIKATEVMVSK
jgi:molybdate transport system regulatory protein